MASSGKKRERGAPLLGSGRVGGYVKSGQPNLGKAVCVRLKAVQGRESTRACCWAGVCVCMRIERKTEMRRKVSKGNWKKGEKT